MQKPLFHLDHPLHLWIFLKLFILILFFFQDALFLTAVFNSCLNPLVYGGFYFKALTRRSFGKSASWRGESVKPDRRNRNNIETKLWKRKKITFDSNGVTYFVKDVLIEQWKICGWGWQKERLKIKTIRFKPRIVEFVRLSNCTAFQLKFRIFTLIA